jgi:CRP-like cAMP-binding protein
MMPLDGRRFRGIIEIQRRWADGGWRAAPACGVGRFCPMSGPYTAILQLREADPLLARGVLQRLFRPLRGIRDIQFKPADSLVTVRFDQRLTGLAEIVRTIEDGGSIVSSVAQRRADPSPAGSDHEPIEAAHGASANAIA